MNKPTEEQLSIVDWLRNNDGILAVQAKAGTGIIDLDYPDEIKLVVTSLDPTYRIKKGDKVAQILLKEHKTYLLGIDTEDERVGGLGSTDVPSYNVSKEDLEYQLNRLTPKVHGDKK